MNNDGNRKRGFTAPSLEAQAQVIAEALAIAEVAPETIGYVEAHGTATAIGDVIEVEALAQAFGRVLPQSCLLGSIKGNIGHTNTAAGIAGLLKAVLMVERGKIPPTVNFYTPNPGINFAHSPFKVADRLQDWRQPAEHPRRAGVSSFGIGGTNVHAIVEQAPAPAATTQSPWGAYLIAVSAKSEAALNDAVERQASHLEACPELDLADVAFSLAVGRRAMPYRRVALARDHIEAATALRDAVTPARVPDSHRPVAFLFSGQGSQYPGMGAGLHACDAVFRAEVDRCAEILKAHLNLDLRELMFAPAADAAATARLRDTAFAQPALFTVSYAMARRWMAWGLEPAAMLGHSIGEYTAACIAGVFELEEALALVVARGRLMQRMPPGSMLSVPRSEAEILCLLERWPALSLAAVNGPTECVVSGETVTLKEFAVELKRSGAAGIPLYPSHAFHISLTEGVLDDFRRQADAVKRQPPQLPFLSNVSGTWITDEQAVDPDYWTQHMRQTVRFSAGLEELLSHPDRVLVEVGPGHGLTKLAERHPAWQPNHRSATSLVHPEVMTPDADHLLSNLGRLWVAGAEVDWQAFFADEHRRRVPLPTYPFQRQRHWPATLLREAAPAMPTRSAEERLPFDQWFSTRTWERAMPATRAEVPTDGHWLVVSAEEKLGADVSAGLGAAGCRVRAVSNAAAAAGVLAESAAGEPLVEHVVYCADSKVAEHAFLELVQLGVALGRHATTQGQAPELVTITDSMLPVTGNEDLRPGGAMLLGPTLVLPQEFLDLAVRHIDITCDAAALLVVELIAADPPPSVALRGRFRWLPVIRSIDLPTPRAAESASPLVALVTGGLGGVGLEMAEHFARRHARIMLTTRGAFPDAVRWDAWLKRHGDVDRTSRRIKRLRALEAAGAELLVRSADVTDPAAMSAVVEETRRRFGAIDIVVHTAGTIAIGPTEHKTEAGMRQVLAAKVEGARVLDEIFVDSPPEIMVLCSSLAGTVGGAGTVDYSAANAFLDAFAWWRDNARPGRTMAIDWDIWQDVGMSSRGALGEEAYRLRSRDMGFAGISTAEGREVLSRALAAPVPQLIVSLRSPEARVALLLAASASASAPDAPESAESARQLHPRPELATPYKAPRGPLQEALATAFAEALGLDRVGTADNFFDLGADSFLVTQIHGNLQRRLQELQPGYGDRLAVTDLFEHPNVGELAVNLEQEPAMATAAPAGDRRRSRDRAERQRQAMEEDHHGVTRRRGRNE